MALSIDPSVPLMGLGHIDGWTRSGMQHGGNTDTFTTACEVVGTFTLVFVVLHTAAWANLGDKNLFYGLAFACVTGASTLPLTVGPNVPGASTAAAFLIAAPLLCMHHA